MLGIGTDAAVYRRYSGKPDYRCVANHPSNNPNRNTSNITITIKYEDSRSSSEIKQDNFNYHQERVYKPATYNDKVYTLAKEVRTQELKKEMYKDALYIENAFTKAERAIEDRYVTGTSVYSLATDIIEMMKFVDDNKLMRTIVVEADIDDRLHEIKEYYHKFNI